MELLFYGMTALVGLAGGTIILSRSGVSHGRAIACGLLSIAATEICYTVYYLRESLLALQAASFFELTSISFFIVSLASMERNISRRALLVTWVSRGLALMCFLYVPALFYFSEAYASILFKGLVVIGWFGRIQSTVLLICTVAFIWIMENILRSSGPAGKTILKYPALGLISVGASLCMASIYRLGTSTITPDILILCSLITLVGSVILIFFSIRFKLFEMDIFVSRYIVYHSITFISIGAYLLVMGLIILWVRRLGMRPGFVISGFIVFLAVIVLSVLVFSAQAKARLRFFINTHFFSNKYDYRKEWVELSGYLSIAFNEKQIIHVTSEVILNSMYIKELSIWLLDGASFRRAFSFPDSSGDSFISKDHPFVCYLKDNSFFMRRRPHRAGDTLWADLVHESMDFLECNKIELAVGMMAGGMIGFIIVGEENPGTSYGQDDIDLLRAVASQSSAALMSARYAKSLAENKELDTYNQMSAYLLHDLKNAAGHLSLILQNAPKHIDQEEFRGDMLMAIGQALARIDKVMGKLKTIPEREGLHPKAFLFEPLLDELLVRLKPRFDGIEVIRDVKAASRLTTDPDILYEILENIILNAAQAVGDDGRIVITACTDGDDMVISVGDNGVGMSDEFIQERLFKPFQTTKPNGTGLGMWQVKTMADQLGVRLEVTPNTDRGVTFSLRLPGHSIKKTA